MAWEFAIHKDYQALIFYAKSLSLTDASMKKSDHRTPPVASSHTKECRQWKVSSRPYKGTWNCSISKKPARGSATKYLPCPLRSDKFMWSFDVLALVLPLHSKDWTRWRSPDFHVPPSSLPIPPCCRSCIDRRRNMYEHFLPLWQPWSVPQNLHGLVVEGVIDLTAALLDFSADALPTSVVPVWSVSIFAVRSSKNCANDSSVGLSSMLASILYDATLNWACGWILLQYSLNHHIQRPHLQKHIWKCCSKFQSFASMPTPHSQLAWRL